MPNKGTLAKANIIGFETLGYDSQRVIFRKAVEYGWCGPEPSVLGTYSADCSLDLAIEYLLHANRTFSRSVTKRF